jgi:hypothetical protein
MLILWFNKNISTITLIRFVSVSSPQFVAQDVVSVNTSMLELGGEWGSNWWLASNLYVVCTGCESRDKASYMWYSSIRYDAY